MPLKLRDKARQLQAFAEEIRGLSDSDSFHKTKKGLAEKIIKLANSL